MDPVTEMSPAKSPSLKGIKIDTEWLNIENKIYIKTTNIKH